MRRILLLIICASLLAACGDDAVNKGGGKNPLSEYVLSENATCGEEAVIQWNGISQTAKVFLIGEDDTKYEADVKAVTSSGMIFSVPVNVIPGNYRVLLVQGQEIEIGVMEVHETDMPVTGISFPSAVSPGSEFVLGGVGLNDSYDVILKSSSDQTVLDSEMSDGGLTCHVPADLKSGQYTLVLTDGTLEWTLAASFLVSKKKALVAVSKDEPYEDNIRHCSEYRVEYENGEVLAITFTQALTEDSKVTEVLGMDRYVQESPGYFAAEGGKSSSNNIDFRYSSDSDGKIVSADVLRFSNKDPDGVHRVFTYVYDSKGLLTDVQFDLNGKTYSLQDYIYEDDNLKETQACVFVYEEPTLASNPFGPDCAYGFDMMHNIAEPFLYVQYLTGVHPFTSRLLPDGYMAISGATTRVKKPFSYVCDNDGYVVEMSWREDQNSVCYIRYEYAE